MNVWLSSYTLALGAIFLVWLGVSGYVLVTRALFDVADLSFHTARRVLERRLAPIPQVTIHKYPGADHAFARHGGRTYSKPEADRALALSTEFFRTHLG